MYLTAKIKFKGGCAELNVNIDMSYSLTIEKRSSKSEMTGRWHRAHNSSIKEWVESNLQISPITLEEAYYSGVANMEIRTTQFIDLMASKNIYPSPFNYEEIMKIFLEKGQDEAFEYYVKQEIDQRKKQIRAIKQECEERCKYFYEKIDELQNLLAP